MNIVISQPFFFPWIGLFEQIRLANIYVHYDDVAFSKGSFVNRVQIKTPGGFKWVTVPLQHVSLGQHIRDIRINDTYDWRHRHLAFLAQNYAKAPFRDDMLHIVEQVYQFPSSSLFEVVRASIMEVCEYYQLTGDTQFLVSSQMGIGGRSSQRVFDIVNHLHGVTYITGHGAKNYLDHQLFEQHGIRVEYLNYQRRAYPQLYGAFNPHVSILDLIANTGKEGKQYICSGTIYWKEFVHGSC